MRCSNVQGILAILVVTLSLSMAGTAQANGDRQCSLAKSSGRWAFIINGSIPAIGPVAAVGTFSQDASGNISGTETRSLNGSIAVETLTGTAIVNSDCSGTDSFQVFENGILVRTSGLSVVYDDNGREARAVFTSIVLPDGTSLPSIVTVEAHRLFSRD